MVFIEKLLFYVEKKYAAEKFFDKLSPFVDRL